MGLLYLFFLSLQDSPCSVTVGVTGWTEWEFDSWQSHSFCVPQRGRTGYGYHGRLLYGLKRTAREADHFIRLLPMLKALIRSSNPP